MQAGSLGSRAFRSRAALPSEWDRRHFGRHQQVQDYLKVDGLNVKYVGPGELDSQAATIFADKAVPQDVPMYYYEVTIVNKGDSGYIGRCSTFTHVCSRVLYHQACCTIERAMLGTAAGKHGVLCSAAPAALPLPSSGSFFTIASSAPASTDPVCISMARTCMATIHGTQPTRNGLDKVQKRLCKQRVDEDYLWPCMCRDRVLYGHSQPRATARLGASQLRLPWR